MNTKRILTVLFGAAIVVAPVVIGRFGGEIADLLRVDVLLGLGVVATLVALITREYRPTAARPYGQRPHLGRDCQSVARTPQAKLIPLAANETRAAA